MIELKDLKHRDYLGNICFGFDYEINNFKFIFVADKIDEEIYNKIWKITIIPPDGHISRICFELPKDNMPLPMICAIGLKYYQDMLKSEIQIKTTLDCEIGEITQGMIG